MIRIIGGMYRGKKLHFPEIDGLRPTPDRVRETLFNWLMHVIKDARCLDAFAGSGALGLEAWSRGASRVVLVEQSPVAHANLQKILTTLNSTQLKLIKTDARIYLQNCPEQFDIIFLDPPFAKDYIPDCLNDLAKNTVLIKGGLVYVESAAPLHVNPEQWKKIKVKQAGQVHYGLFQKL